MPAKSQPDNCINCGTGDKRKMSKGGYGFCSLCYCRWKSHGDPNKLLRPYKMGPMCTVTGCNNKHDSYGYCRTHSVRFTKYGDPLAYSPDAPHLRKTDRTAKCADDSCDKEIGPKGSNGLCHNHYKAELRRRFPDRYRLLNNANQKQARRATPPWADRAAIKEFYRKTPQGQEVDHIIPLRGERVSGLHVPENLQYLPVTENRRKSNRHAG